MHHIYHFWSLTLLATHSFATCFPEGWLTLAAKTTLAHEGDFRRSLHTAPFTCPFLVDAVVVLGVAFVPFIHFWVGVAFIPSVDFGFTFPWDYSPFRAACTLPQNSESVAPGNFTSRPQLRALGQFGNFPIVALTTKVTVDYLPCDAVPAR